MRDLTNKLTVFVITSGINLNYTNCIKALEKQTCRFNLNIIRDYAPMAAAQQEMLNRITTEYFIQVDDDMVLYENAIEKMYESIQNTSETLAMRCFLLRDVHLDFLLYGVKVYKAEIFKRYPYNLEVISSEVEQLGRLKADGFEYEYMTETYGDHSPLWTNSGIFERYNNLMKKHQIFNYDWTGELPRKLYDIFSADPSILNFYAIAGMIAGINSEVNLNEPRNFKHYNKDFKKLETLFSNNLRLLKPREAEIKVGGKQLRILRLCDQWNWAYDHISREQAVYSRHKILSKRLMDLKVTDLKDIDILYIPGPNMGFSGVRNTSISTIRSTYPNCRIVCGYAGEHNIMYPDADIIVSISAKFYPKLKEMYRPKNIPVVFLPESADTNFFTPLYFPDKFTVGWAGRDAPVKRCHLLDQLPFPVLRQSNHGGEFFKNPNRSLQPMKEFYQSLSALVLTSSSEAMPRVVLEGMSCGLPIVATDVGSLRMLMDSEWLVAVNPEPAVVLEMGERLIRLEANPELAKEVGIRNRAFIEEYFSWKVNQPLWDSFFDELAKKHYKSIEIYNKAYRTKYGKLEPALLK